MERNDILENFINTTEDFLIKHPKTTKTVATAIKGGYLAIGSALFTLVTGGATLMLVDGISRIKNPMEAGIVAASSAITGIIGIIESKNLIATGLNIKINKDNNETNKSR